jgi:hypothetical protein
VIATGFATAGAASALEGAALGALEGGVEAGGVTGAISGTAFGLSGAFLAALAAVNGNIVTPSNASSLEYVTEAEADALLQARATLLPGADCQQLSAQMVEALGSEYSLVSMYPARGSTLAAMNYVTGGTGWYAHVGVVTPSGAVLDPLVGAVFPSTSAWQQVVVGTSSPSVSSVIRSAGGQ